MTEPTTGDCPEGLFESSFYDFYAAYGYGEDENEETENETESPEMDIVMIAEG